MTALGRLLTAMVTPYDSDGAVDYQHARPPRRRPCPRRQRRRRRHRHHRRIAAALRRREVRALGIDQAGTGQRATVVAGAGTNDTRHSVHLAHLAERAGADAILAVVPYYLKPPQEGIFQHFRAIAESTSLPVIIYNVPGRVGTGMTVETVLRCAEIPNIVGNKEANGDLAFTAEVMEAAPDFEIWSGNDNDNFHLWCMGAWGAISVTSHIVAWQQKADAESHPRGPPAGGRRDSSPPRRGDERRLPERQPEFDPLHPAPARRSQSASRVSRWSNRTQALARKSWRKLESTAWTSL